MAVQRSYGLNGKSCYQNIAKPMSTWLNFTVLATNGVGVTSVKSNGYVEYVFMHTSTTPSSTNGYLNPNPPSGYALISLKNNAFNSFVGVRGTVVAPATSTTTTSTTANSVFVITALGTATAAQWSAVGLPAGMTAAVGQSFVATASQSIGGSATVGVPGVSNVGAISIVGEPTVMAGNSNIAANSGAQIILLFQDFAGAAVAPTASSIVRLELVYDGSSVTIDGL
jgi:hypothetical protein